MTDDILHTHIQATARILPTLLYPVWSSEEAMAAYYQGNTQALSFDRTDNGRWLCASLFNKAWELAKQESGWAHVPAFLDRFAVLQAWARETTDYNLFTQVAVNLVDLNLKLDVEKVEEALNDLRPLFTSDEAKAIKLPNPFEAKKATKVSKLVYPNPTLVTAYQGAWGLLKAKEIFSLSTVLASHRITPIGSTPTIIDSRNLSGLPTAADPFVSSPNNDLVYLFWQEGTADSVFPLTPGPGGSLMAFSLPAPYNTFISKSGGQILTNVLLARQVAFKAWKAWGEMVVTGPCLVLPRFGSVMLAGRPQDLRFLVEAVTADFPWIVSGPRRPAKLDG